MQVISDRIHRLRDSGKLEAQAEAYSQKSVAVFGEAESTLFYCCRKEIVEYSGV